MFSLLQCVIHVNRVFSYTVKQVCDSQLNEVIENGSHFSNVPY